MGMREAQIGRCPERGWASSGRNIKFCLYCAYLAQNRLHKRQISVIMTNGASLFWPTQPEPQVHKEVKTQ